MNMVQYYEPSSDEEENIFNKFNRTKKMVQEDVQTITEWMKTQPHLPEVMDANSIKNFLIFSKCSVELAKEKIELRYLMRKKIPDIFVNMPNTNKVLDAMYWVPLPRLTEDLCRVYIYKIRSPRLSTQITHLCYTVQHLKFTEIYLKESLQLNVSIIFDLAEVTKANFRNLSPDLFRKAAVICQKVYKYSLKAVYIMNAPSYLQNFMPVVRSIAKPKQLEKIHFCKSANDLLDIFPKQILPVDYGGDEKSLEELNEMIKQKFLEYQSRFDEVENFVINEALWPRKLTNDEFLGFYGNFRKIDVD